MSLYRASDPMSSCSFNLDNTPSTPITIPSSSGLIVQRSVNGFPTRRSPEKRTIFTAPEEEVNEGFLNSGIIIGKMADTQERSLRMKSQNLCPHPQQFTGWLNRLNASWMVRLDKDYPAFQRLVTNMKYPALPGTPEFQCVIPCIVFCSLAACRASVCRHNLSCEMACIASMGRDGGGTAEGWRRDGGRWRGMAERWTSMSDPRERVATV